MARCNDFRYTWMSASSQTRRFTVTVTVRVARSFFCYLNINNPSSSSINYNAQAYGNSGEDNMVENSLYELGNKMNMVNIDPNSLAMKQNSAIDGLDSIGEINKEIGE